MIHDQAEVGLWTASDNEETWGGESFFDTREEAIEYAQQNDLHYVGRVEIVATPEWVADQALDYLTDTSGPFGLDGHIREQDEWGWLEEELIAPGTPAMQAELREFLVSWYTKHELVERRWCITDSEEVDHGQ